MRTNRFSLFATLFATIFAISSCAPKSQNLIIISTSDIHSAIDRLPQLATLIDQAHAQDTAQVFVVDAGDRWTGNAYVDMATHAGQPIIEQMNRLGYDVATIGNHEFDMGLDTLQARIDDAEFDVVLANVNTGNTPLKQPKPYVIKRAGGVKVGFLGIVTNYANGHPDGDDPTFVGTEFYSPEQTAERYGAELRRKSDVMVVISHCGLDRDTTNVASSFPYADLIISGHTHECYDGKAQGVQVIQGNNKLRAVGLTTIKVEKGKVVDIQSRFIDLPAEGKASVAAEVEAYKQDPYLIESIGTLTAEANKTGLAQLMTDTGRQTVGTDLGFYHIGGTRIGHLPAGEVKRATIYELEPFKSYLVITKMTLAQIEEMIINKFNDTTNYKESHRVDLIPSGLTYIIDTDAKGNAVRVHLRPEVKKDVYTVAISDYVYGNKTYKYTRQPEDGRTELVTDYLIELFSRGPVTPDNTPRGFIARSYAD